MFYKVEQPDMLRKIIAQIKDNIATGQLKKGDRLPSERQLVEMLGLSRATIREAIKSLETLGIIDCAHGSGNYISSSLSNSMGEPLSIMFMLESGTAEHTFQFRRSLEFSTAGLAAALAEPEEVEAMMHTCDLMEQAADEAAKSVYDRQLHMEIARAAKNPLLITLLNACEDLLQESIRGARQQIIAVTQNEDIINVQHRRLVAAIADGNVRAAENAMLAHLRIIMENALPEEARAKYTWGQLGL